MGIQNTEDSSSELLFWGAPRCKMGELVTAVDKSSTADTLDRFELAR